MWLLWSVPRCGAADAARRAGGVGAARPLPHRVIVPARDEESTLPRLLASLAVQGHAPDSVIVVDDGSTDATAEVARRSGATVVSCVPLPDGWTGKSWACWTGAGAAGDAAILVFLDADTEVEPGGLDRVLAEHRRRSGLVSVQPFHETGRLHERLSAYFNVVAMMGVDAFSPLRDRVEPRGAFGPCLVTSRHDYLLVGGHRAVRSEVVEDVALARRYTAAGLPVSCFGGRGTVRFRMYAGGLGQLVEGWSKNFATGASATRPLTFALVSLWLSGTISAAWQLPRAAVGAGAFTFLAAAGLYGAYAAQLWWMLARIGRFGRWGLSTAAAFPVPLAFFLAVFARSVVLTNVRREVTWRGRRVSTRP